MSERLLTLTKISKRFGAVQALTDVDFHVDSGEAVALVGDNGAGKSTLVKVMSGVGPPTGGTIEFRGGPVTIDTPQAATALGIATVYQDLALCDNLDVVGNLFLGNEVNAGPLRWLNEIEMERRANELLKTVAIRIPSVRIQVASLSGGQRQSVAIARSLLGEPSVVLLDEPTAALGVAQTAMVLDLIEQIKRQDHGVVVISHNLADVFAVCDRVMVLRLGKNGGEFRVAEATQEQIVGAITGAIEHAPVPGMKSRRAGLPATMTADPDAQEGSLQ